MSIQLVAIEGYGVSFIKVSLMVVSIFVFFIKVPYVTKSLIFCGLYWFTCFFTAIFQEYFRFSTLGYLGLFLISFITFYNIIHLGSFSLSQFKSVLRFILLSYFFFLIMQQMFVLIGIRSFPFFNLVNEEYYLWNRLPTISCEPSHSARIITAAMLGYIRCLEIEYKRNITFIDLFNKNNINVTISYIWLIFTMGSGTGWIGFVIICLYFIRLKTILYMFPLFLSIFLLLNYTGNKQFNRAFSSIKATLTGNVEIIYETDGSGSVRIIPLVNTFTKIDLTKKETWIGNGTSNLKKEQAAWKNFDRKISVVEQYGLLGLLSSFIFVFTCVIYRFFSLETVCFIVLLLCSIGNEYFTWSMVFIFSAIRYFQEQFNKNGCINNYCKL